MFKHVQTLVRRSSEMTTGLHEFGMSFTTLGQAEAGALGDGLTQTGAAADKLSSLANAKAEKEALVFEEPIHEYMRIVGAVKVAISKRNEMRTSYQAALTELDAKEAHHRKYAGQAGKEEKAEKATQDVEKAKIKAEAIQQQYELVSRRVLEEVHRFRDSKRVDFKVRPSHSPVRCCAVVLIWLRIALDYRQ
jgi:sorting nexin-1/2